jgi:sugar phosphate isomerase/epimerase
MKLSFPGGPEPLEEYFPFADENGFQWIELHCGNPKNFPATFNIERINNIKKLRDKYHVRLGVHSASYVNTAEIEPTVRRGVEQHLLDYVELAHQFEAEYLVLHFGFHFSQFLEEVFQSLIKTFTPVVELAEKYDIPIGIENMNKVHEDCEIVYLGVTIEELSKVFQALPTKYLGLTFDIAHASLLPGGPVSFIEAFPDKIVSIHISDTDLYLDRHFAVGEGKIDFREVLGLLKGIGFKGVLNIEVDTDEDRLLSKQRLEPMLRDLGITS